MKAFFFATGLCCLLRSLPAFSFVPSGSVSVSMTARNPIRRSNLSAMTTGGSFQPQVQNLAARQEEGLCSGGGSAGSSSSRSEAGRGRGRLSRQHQQAGLRRGGWTIRSKFFRGRGLLGALFSSSSSSSTQDGEDDDVESDVEEATSERRLREAIADGSAAAASTSAVGLLGSSAVGGGDGAIDAAAGDGGVVSNEGISWATLSAVVASQLAIFGFFGWLASSPIRQQVLSAFTASPAAAALGVAGMVPLLAYGLALDTRKDWDWVKKIDDATSEVALQLFGSERQVAKVTGVVIPLSMLVGFCEECAFRGFLPLILAAKTGLPPAAVVVLSGVIFGSLHAATLAYFLTATVSGMFFHGLLLSTGNIFVPIAAHAVYDAIALVRYHFKVTARKPE